MVKEQTQTMKSRGFPLNQLLDLVHGELCSDGSKLTLDNESNFNHETCVGRMEQ